MVGWKLSLEVKSPSAFTRCLEEFTSAARGALQYRVLRAGVQSGESWGPLWTVPGLLCKRFLISGTSSPARSTPGMPRSVFTFLATRVLFSRRKFFDTVQIPHTEASTFTISHWNLRVSIWWLWNNEGSNNHYSRPEAATEPLQDSLICYVSVGTMMRVKKRIIMILTSLSCRGDNFNTTSAFRKFGASVNQHVFLHSKVNFSKLKISTEFTNFITSQVCWYAFRMTSASVLKYQWFRLHNFNVDDVVVFKSLKYY